MMENIKSVSLEVSQKEKKMFELDEALDIAGLGVYNLKYCLLFAWFLISSIIEVIGYSYVLPAARCDLNISDSQRGFIASLPYIGIIITSFPWGYVVDVQGRKRMLVLSAILTGGFGMLASFMPEMNSFVFCKFLANICLACPSAIPYAFIGEILPRKHRDIALSVTNSMQMFGSVLVPLLAWAILPLDITTNFGSYNFRSWRLLSAVYSACMVVAALLMMLGPESPKYLVAQGRHDDAMDVLRTMFAQNQGKSPEDFPVKSLKMPNQDPNGPMGLMASIKSQTLPVIRPPYLKWLILNGVLLFGIFSTLNGLTMWIPDVLNRVISDNSNVTMTACQTIRKGLNETSGTDTVICQDTIATSTYVINSVANTACAMITLVISFSLKVISKKLLLHLLFFILGLFCILINFTTQKIIFAMLLASMQITATGIGPVNAFSVDIFPTHLRGMAVSLSLMLGRCGSVVGTNVAGVLINNVCEATFYLFGGILLFCGLLTFLLPKPKKTDV